MESKTNSAADRMRVALGTILVLAFVVVVMVVLVIPQATGSQKSYEENFLVTIDGYTFPDRAWREYVLERIDLNKDHFLSVAERERVIEIGSYDPESLELVEEGLSSKGITSLKGIEYFPNIESLVAQDNQITSLNISNNPVIARIDLRGNPQFSVEYADINRGAQVLIEGGSMTIGEQ